MTKAEMIERYGIEWYEEQKRKSIESHRTKEYTEYCRKFHAERYKDPTNRKHRNAQNCEYIKTRVCKEYWKVENYELAKADNFEGWCMHHRLELHSDCSLRFTRKSLIKIGLYYNRPPNELIWLTKSEHMIIHNSGNKHESKRET